MEECGFKLVIFCANSVLVKSFSVLNVCEGAIDQICYLVCLVWGHDDKNVEYI